MSIEVLVITEKEGLQWDEQTLSILKNKLVIE